MLGVGRLESALVLVVVLVLVAIVVSIVAPELQATLVEALSPIQEALQSAPVQ